MNAEQLAAYYKKTRKYFAWRKRAAAHVAKAARDSDNLLLEFVGQLAMLPHGQKVAYKALNDFVGVTLLASSYHVLVVNPSVPARTAKELIVLAKGHAGELNYASCGLWTPSHLVPELFKAATATDIVRSSTRAASPPLSQCFPARRRSAR